MQCHVFELEKWCHNVIKMLFLPIIFTHLCFKKTIAYKDYFIQHFNHLPPLIPLDTQLLRY